MHTTIQTPPVFSSFSGLSPVVVSIFHADGTLFERSESSGMAAPGEVALKLQVFFHATPDADQAKILVKCNGLHAFEFSREEILSTPLDVFSTLAFFYASKTGMLILDIDPLGYALCYDNDLLVAIQKKDAGICLRIFDRSIECPTVESLTHELAELQNEYLGD